MVIIRVQNTLFKIHRYFLLRESELFGTLFDLPAGDMAAEGQTDLTALPLHDVTCREFESLLDFLYKSMHDDAKLTLPQWIDVLSISTRYICDKIRDRAIREIHQHHPRINPIEKIVLALQFDVPDWLAPSYEAICQRAHPLEIEEAQRLGIVISTQLARAREAIRQEACFRTTPDHTRAPTPDLPFPPMDEPFTNEWPGLIVPDLYEPYEPHRVAEIVQEVFWPRR